MLSHGTCQSGRFRSRLQVRPDAVPTDRRSMEDAERGLAAARLGAVFTKHSEHLAARLAELRTNAVQGDRPVGQGWHGVGPILSVKGVAYGAFAHH
jgi:hypothetical protein